MATAGVAADAGLAGTSIATSDVGATLGEASFWLSLPGVALDASTCVSDIKQNTSACVAAGFGVGSGVLGKIPNVAAALRGGELSTTPVLVFEGTSLTSGSTAFIIDGQTMNSEMLDDSGK